MAQSEPCVRHALIALGYLNRTETGTLKSARAGLVAPSPHKTLLFHYNKALACLVQRISEPSYFPDIGLVTCLLFVCIEFLRGNYDGAWAHFNSGLKIIADLRKRRKIPSARNMKSSNPGIIEKTLIPIFIRMMATGVIYGVPSEQVLAASVYPITVPDRPFTSIEEAETSIYNIRNTTMLLVRNVGTKLIPRKPILDSDWQHQKDLPGLHRAYYRELIELKRKAMLSNDDTNTSSTIEFHEARYRELEELERKSRLTPENAMAANSLTLADLEQQEDVLELHRAWFRSLTAFERGSTLSKEDTLTAHALKISYYCTYIITAAATYTDQTSYDQHLPLFKAIIAHSRAILDAASPPPPSASPAAHFTFEISVIPYLYITASRCRCPSTRREALALLERNPPREGLWDAQQHAAVARRIVEIEEGEVDPVTGWPVERTRIWSTIVNGEMDGNGRFPVYFARGLWGEGRGVPPLPPDMVLTGCPYGRMWKEWIVL